jgi:hypothetical protein
MEEYNWHWLKIPIHDRNPGELKGSNQIPLSFLANQQDGQLCLFFLAIIDSPPKPQSIASD